MQPDEIEALSFKIIDQEAGPHDFPDDKWQIVRRMIHTSADFDYMETTRFHPKAISAGIQAIQTGRAIVTDTHMALAGIRKQTVDKFGGSTTCLINDASVVAAARQAGSTRAKAAAEAAAEIMDGGIYVVGNAPTALFEVIRLISTRQAAPALVVGLPVGFVNAAESKQALMELDIPYITNVGRKGGSNLAASVINALIIQATAEGRQSNG
ncbi:MAG: Cobalt-precorrin-8 methylmutase (EC 5.4.99.60) [Olavius algarvensis Delta 4 endosymbiont]|nr:MAG: Cobalt-precorrin-8 methylmutase (EC 5.4.99.60) [Olavius algarvensis Delta 4 endosymbiont]